MQALQFNVDVPRFIAAKALGTVLGQQTFCRGPTKTLSLVDIAEPRLPGPDWVKIQTAYCGFCGSDLNLILLHDSPTASPFTSFPCIIGHEAVGQIAETGSAVDDLSAGDRVAVNPILSCKVRGISPVCQSCAAGRPGNCENYAEGDFPPGMFLGINRRLNGGFAPYMAAHRSQVYRLPGELTTETAVMAEPAAVALQAVLDNLPAPDERVLVIGGGVIGNLMIQTARAVAPNCHISVIEPSAFAADTARQTGADEIIAAKEVFSRTAAITNARIYKPMLGMEIAAGGFARIYDAVGSSSTLNLSMRLLAATGTLSVVGIGGDVKLDLTPLWLKLQTVKGAYAYGRVTVDGQVRDVFELALEFMAEGKIDAGRLVTHKFHLSDYRRMIAVNSDKARHQAFKTVAAFQ